VLCKEPLPEQGRRPKGGTWLPTPSQRGGQVTGSPCSCEPGGAAWETPGTEHSPPSQGRRGASPQHAAKPSLPALPATQRLDWHKEICFKRCWLVPPSKALGVAGKGSLIASLESLSTALVIEEKRCNNIRQKKMYLLLY